MCMKRFFCINTLIIEEAKYEFYVTLMFKN